MQTISICGSMVFLPQMIELGHHLEKMAITAFLPTDDDADYQAMRDSAQISLKGGYIDDHLAKIRQSDGVLIANYDKHGIAGYIGPNTLMEIAFAYALQKQIFLLYPPGEQGCRLEVLGLNPQIIDGDLSTIGSSTNGAN